MVNIGMGKLGIGLGQRRPPKPQLTQQRKPTWLVECNCPTCRSWQSDKAVTPVLRRTWEKTNEGQGNDPQRNPKENYIGHNRGKEKEDLPGGATNNQVSMYGSKSWSTNQTNGMAPIIYSTDQIKNTTKKKAPPD